MGLIEFFAYGYFIAYLFFLVLIIIIKVKYSPGLFWIINMLFLFSVFIIAYTFEPPMNYDLFRYHRILGIIKDYSFDRMLNYGPYRETIITNSFFYFVSKTNNFSLFSAIPTTMIFGLIIFASWKFINIFSVKFSHVSFFIISIISTSGMLGIISGVRQNWAWAFLMIAIYYDFFSNNQNKIIKVFLYFIASAIHLSSLPILIIRLVYNFLKINNTSRFFFLFWPLIIVFLNQIYAYLPILFQITLDQFEIYENFDLVITPLLMIKVFVYILLIQQILKIEKMPFKWSVLNKDFINFYMILLLFGLSSFYVPTLFGRIQSLVIFISLPIFSDLLNLYTIGKNIKITILAVTFLLQFVYQDLIPFARLLNL